MSINSLSLSIALFLCVFYLNGQEANRYITGAKGAGETTGHIADLSVENNGKTKLTLELGPYLIPARDKYQGYIVPGTIQIQLEPGESGEIPVHGYCTDIHKPPVPSGSDMPSFDSWTTIESQPTSYGVEYFSSSEHGVADREGSNRSFITFPGSDIIIDQVVDIDEQAGRTGPLLLDAIESIDSAYDSLTAAGALDISIPLDPDTQRESIIQQTFWIYTAALEGDTYTNDDFHTMVIEQFENNSGRNFEDLAVEEQNEIETGAANLWDGFELVGANAKIFREPGEQVEALENTEEQTTGAVECDCSYATIRNVGIQQAGEEVPYGILNPGNYQLKAEIETDCPSDCELTIDGRWLLTFVPDDGGTILQFRGEGQSMNIEIPDKGRLDVQFRGSVHCNGMKCPIEDPIFHDEYLFDPCICSDCRLVEPIRIINTETGEELTRDSIPWGIELGIMMPEAESDCPEDCAAEEHIAVHWYSGYRYRNDTSSTDDEYFTVKGLHPGLISLDGICHCNCEDRYCGHVRDHRLIRLYESNNCCDRLREAPNGQLLFHLEDGQSVEVFNDQMIIELNPDIEETIDFDINIEALFCNMEEGQVYGALEVASGSSVQNGDITEVYNASDLTLEYYTEEDALSPNYTLSYSSTVNGKELTVHLTLDERTCTIDIAVYYDGEYIETAGPPHFSPDELVELMDDYSAQYLDREITRHRFLNRMFQIYMQLYKGVEQGRFGYHESMTKWMAKLSRHIDWMLEDGISNPQLVDALEELADVLDASQADYIGMLFALIDVINAMHQY